jgi:DNA-directed RNA polymerase specialized sigma24 family protein
MAADTTPRSFALDSLRASAADPESTRVARTPPSAQVCEPDPHLSVYRKYTVALLQHYMQLSMEVGRLPSLLGREVFRSRISYVRPSTFEDAVILVIDMDRCLAQLDAFSQQLIVRAVLQEYSWEHTGLLLGISRRSVANFLPMAIDQLTEILLAKKILCEFRRKM